MGSLNCLEATGTPCLQDERCEFERPPSMHDMLSSLLSDRSPNKSPITANPLALPPEPCEDTYTESMLPASDDNLSPPGRRFSMMDGADCKNKEGWASISPDLTPAETPLDVTHTLGARPYNAVVSKINNPELMVLIERNMVITGVDGRHQSGRSFESVVTLLHSFRYPVELELLALDGRTVTHKLKDWSHQIVLTNRAELIETLKTALAGIEEPRSGGGVDFEDRWYAEVDQDTPYLSPDGTPQQTVIGYLSLENLRERDMAFKRSSSCPFLAKRS